MGQASNRFGYGARVTIPGDGGSQVRTLWPQSGFLSSNDPLVHFGVGTAQEVDEIIVEWPSGRQQIARDLPTGQVVTIEEPPVSGATGQQASVGEAHPLLASWSSLPAVAHVESTFDEFARWPLLPRGLARSGPSLAAGDFNGDGVDDLFVGGAAGRAATLLASQPDGSLAPCEMPALSEDRGCEDMGAVWFDAEGDGDLDLYVASGSSEFPAGDPRHGDRLYLNHGNATLSRAPAETLPQRLDFSSIVCAADYDRDGDIDLFVGTRAVVGSYPGEGAASRLLVNEGGRFREAPAESARALADAGMVTSALWSDVDQDGWLDLLVASEWGPVRLFRNQRGQLVDTTSEAGLASLTGWFQSLAGRDLDGDGDIDFVALNFGLNTTYRASDEEPLLLFAGDIQGGGGYELMEARVDHGRTVPLRRLQALRTALPLLELNFPRTRDYAEASLEQIVPANRLAACHRFQCNTLASLVLRNDGRGRFRGEALPWQVQAAPAFSLWIGELDGDGFADIVVGQNFDEARPSAGSMNGGLGVVLLGCPGGRWQALSPDQSGLFVTGPAKALAECHLPDPSDAHFAMACNGQPLRGWRTQHAEALAANPHAGGRRLLVSLQGLPGNPQAYGARVACQPSDGPLQVAEVVAGSGYLSQSTAVLAFGLPAGAAAATIRVSWPDGTHSVHEVSRAGRVRLTHPGHSPSTDPQGERE